MTRRFVLPSFDSERELRDLYAELCTSLYSSGTSATIRQIGIEWALIFKIDCDRARKKYGSIDYAIAHYMAEGSLPSRLAAIKRAMEAQVQAAGVPEEETPKSKRKRSRSSADLLRRYSRYGAEATDWIEANKQALDADEKHTAEGFKDSPLFNAHSLSSIPETGKLTAVH